MNWIVYLLFLFELVHTLQWLSMDASTTSKPTNEANEMQILKILRNFKKYFQKHRPTRCCETRNRQKTQGDASNCRIHERTADKVETRSKTKSNSQLAPRIRFTSNIVDNDNDDNESNRSRITRRSNSTARRTSRSVACRRSYVPA